MQSRGGVSSGVAGGLAPLVQGEGQAPCRVSATYNIKIDWVSLFSAGISCKITAVELSRTYKIIFKMRQIVRRGQRKETRLICFLNRDVG